MSMNNHNIKWIFAGLIAVLCTLLILSLYIGRSLQPASNPINELRVETNQLYEEITDMWPLTEDDIDTISTTRNQELSYTIIGLDETIVYSCSTTIDLSAQRLLQQSYHMDESYMTRYPNRYKLTQPIYDGDDVVGFVIFEREYPRQNTPVSIGKRVVDIFAVVVAILLVVISGREFFANDRSELVAIEKGLRSVIKGSLGKISVPTSSQYTDVYHTYNTMIDELVYMTQQRIDSEGQQKAFLTRISHELKTPIATINAYIEGLAQGVATDSEARERYLAIISDKMQQLTRQVEDFFSYTQERVNQFKYNCEECYADVLIEKIFASIAGQDETRIDVQNQLPKCIINVDKIRIEQVVMNLYNNAKKHTDSSQQISLRAYRQDEDIVIEVQDTGEGISAKDLPYVFDSYYQGQHSKEKDYSGIGLGLSICKSIVDSHNGSMRVVSREGVGTTMYVMIPVA